LQRKGNLVLSIIVGVLVVAGIFPSIGGTTHQGALGEDETSRVLGGSFIEPALLPALFQGGENAEAYSSEALGGFFTENVGQVGNPDVLFYGSIGDMRFAFASNGVLLDILERPSHDAGFAQDAAGLDARSEGVGARGVLVRITFGESRTITPYAKGGLQHRSNFLLGDDQARWRTGVRNYEEIVYGDLYEGIDLTFRVSPNGLKYEFIVSPTASPEDIVLEYQGIESLRAEDGLLVLHTSLGDIRDVIPRSYQIGGGEVACRFIERGEFSVGFECDGWDRSGPLVIDPLAYSTFLGGSSDDSAAALDVDSSGYAYVTGCAISPNFPTTPGAYSVVNAGVKDVFVAKLTQGGDSLVYSTFIGGGMDDEGIQIKVDSSGNAFVAGDSYSTDFPKTVGAYDTTLNGGRDAIVLRLSPAGDALMYSTYVGGSLEDRAQHLFIDAAGNAYITGDTNSANYPTTAGAYDTSYNGGGNDPFVTKLNPTGSSLIFSTFIGGSGEDEGHVIEADSSGNVYIVGHAGAGNFPTTAGAFDQIFAGTAEAFVAKLNAAGSALIYSTFLGGSNAEDAYGMDINSAGEAYITGKTRSANFQTTAGAFDTSYNGGGDDVFVAKLNSAGSNLVYSTFVGGAAGSDVGADLVVSATGIVFVTGETTSSDYPTTPMAYDTTQNGNRDCFVMVVSRDGSSLLYSTFLGGSGDESSASIFVDSVAGVYVAGITSSPNYPTTAGAYDETYNGGASDGFVTKLGVNIPPIAINLGVQGFINPPGILHVTDFTPVLNWTYYDAEGDPQVSYMVRVGSTPGSNDMWAPGPQAGGSTSVTYAGALPSRGTDYYFGVRVSDNSWGDWREVLFHVNSIPVPPPAAIDPPDTGTVAANPSQAVTWQASTDAEGDTVTYEWEVSTDSSFSTVLASGTGTATTSTAFATSIGSSYYWRSRARDDYEPTTWSAYGNSPPGYWSFSVADDPPTAVAYAPVTVSFMGVVLNFDGTGSTDDVGITSYLWEFGDGATDTSVLTSHLYASRGTFTVNLTVWDTRGQSDKDSLSIQIRNRAPVAEAGPDRGAFKNDLVSLDATGSTDVDGDTLSYVWTQNFGPSVILNGANTATPTFMPTAKGTHRFILTVTDGYGGTGADFVVIMVWNRAPIANLTATPGETFVGFAIHIDGSASTDPDGIIVDYAFDFGDGAAAHGPVSYINHAFGGPGHFNVTLTVTDDDGNTSAVRVRVTVNPPSIEPNWKPLVALIFAVVLGLVGIWPARRRPWKRLETREAVLKSWCAMSLPLLVVESATGVVSFFTGLLAVPPIMGLGMIVDLLILVSGVAALAVLALTAKPPETLLPPLPPPPWQSSP